MAPIPARHYFLETHWRVPKRTVATSNQEDGRKAMSDYADLRYGKDRWFWKTIKDNGKETEYIKSLNGCCLQLSSVPADHVLAPDYP
jgi:hypothetical protein